MLVIWKSGSYRTAYFVTYEQRYKLDQAELLLSIFSFPPNLFRKFKQQNYFHVGACSLSKCVDHVRSGVNSLPRPEQFQFVHGFLDLLGLKIEH